MVSRAWAFALPFIAASAIAIGVGCNWILGFEDNYVVAPGGPSCAADIDMQRDPANCGRCGNVCAAGLNCKDGYCGSVRQVSAGGSFACARLDDGTVKCWGGNEAGQLGMNPANDETCFQGAHCHWQPRTVPFGDVKLTTISTGYDFACGLAAPTGDNPTTAIYCWGSNEFSQLGHARGALGDQLPPAGPKEESTCRDVDGDPIACNWTPHVVGERMRDVFGAVAAGWESACAALKSDGTTFCWGSNRQYVRGTEASDAGVEPNIVKDGDSLSKGSADLTMSLGNARACGRDMDGNLTHCWGDNQGMHDGLGGLGDETFTDAYSAKPITVRTASTDALSGVVRTVTLEGASCAQAYDGVWCWGSNYYGVLGTPSVDGGGSAARVPDLPAVDDISGTYHHVCTIKDGGVSCWGINGAGQLGRGTLSDDEACTPRKCAQIAGPIPGFDARAISSGAEFSVALRADGTVWAWGSNLSGKCGQPADAEGHVEVCARGAPCFPAPRRIMGIENPSP